MAIPQRIHITGASGSGTSTLGRAIAASFGHLSVDTDDFYWLPTDPPYVDPRPRELRLPLLRDTLKASDRWVLSGSLCGWGDPLIPEFELVVFLLVPKEVRLARLRAREMHAFGDRIDKDAALRQSISDFLDWASQYDDGGHEMRSRARHEKWLAGVPCPVLRFEGDMTIECQVIRIKETYADAV